MPGRIKKIIDRLVTHKAQGNPVLIPLIKAKLVMKGISPDKYTSESEDDPVVLGKLMALAKDLGVDA